MAIEEVQAPSSLANRHILTGEQEFSIEIPDKEADAIHSSMLPSRPLWTSRVTDYFLNS
jgi:hypothetical protein